MPFLLSWHFLISNHTLRARKQESLTFHTALYLFWEDNKDCLLNKYLIRLIIHSNMLYRAISWCLRQSERTTYFFVNRPFKNPSGQMISSNNKASKVSSLMHVSRSIVMHIIHVYLSFCRMECYCTWCTYHRHMTRSATRDYITFTAADARDYITLASADSKL